MSRVLAPLILATVLGHPWAFAGSLCGVGMPDDDVGDVISLRTPESELEAFASFFHQDFAMEYPDIRSGVVHYLTQLDAPERAALRNELETFLLDHQGDAPEALRQAWFDLGADYWPLDGGRQILRDVLEMLP
jgi:hypothetical protein